MAEKMTKQLLTPPLCLCGHEAIRHLDMALHRFNCNDCDCPAYVPDEGENQ